MMTEMGTLTFYDTDLTDFVNYEASLVESEDPTPYWLIMRPPM